MNMSGKISKGPVTTAGEEQELHSMARQWKPHDFDSLYERHICREEIQFGGVAYYRRYRSRCKECIKRFAALAPAHPFDVLDICGGQLALMCTKFWSDHGTVVDFPGPRLLYM